MTDVIEWGGGEVWKLVEGGDVICNGKQVMVLGSRLFTWGTQLGVGRGEAENACSSKHAKQSRPHMLTRSHLHDSIC